MKIQIGELNAKSVLVLENEEEKEAFARLVSMYMETCHENPFEFPADLMAEKLEEEFKPAE